MKYGRMHQVRAKRCAALDEMIRLTGGSDSDRITDWWWYTIHNWSHSELISPTRLQRSHSLHCASWRGCMTGEKEQDVHVGDKHGTCLDKEESTPCWYVTISIAITCVWGAYRHRKLRMWTALRDVGWTLQSVTQGCSLPADSSPRKWSTPRRLVEATLHNTIMIIPTWCRIWSSYNVIIWDVFVWSGKTVKSVALQVLGCHSIQTSAGLPLNTITLMLCYNNVIICKTSIIILITSSDEIANTHSSRS